MPDKAQAVIDAAREYYSCSEIIISDERKENLTLDDRMRQGLAAWDLRDALLALDKPETARPVRPVPGDHPPADFPSKCAVEFGGREVIESKLLAALNDENKVAVLLERTDIDHLIYILEFYETAAGSSHSGRRARWAATMADDLNQLRTAAFGRAQPQD